MKYVFQINSYDIHINELYDRDRSLLRLYCSAIEAPKMS